MALMSSRVLEVIAASRFPPWSGIPRLDLIRRKDDLCRHLPSLRPVTAWPEWHAIRIGHRPLPSRSARGASWLL